MGRFTCFPPCIEAITNSSPVCLCGWRCVGGAARIRPHKRRRDDDSHCTVPRGELAKKNRILFSRESLPHMAGAFIELSPARTSGRVRCPDSARHTGHRAKAPSTAAETASSMKTATATVRAVVLDPDRKKSQAVGSKDTNAPRNADQKDPVKAAVFPHLGLRRMWTTHTRTAARIRWSSSIPVRELHAA